MATVAIPRSERKLDLRVSDAVLAAITLVVLTALSIYVRTRAISGSFWMDEGLSVGISSHDLFDIPKVLREDGSPPLYYMGLHVWMDIFGRTETAVHWFSLTASLLTIPSAMWAGWSLWGKRAGFIGAALCSLNPFLTSYGEEARMYALMTLWALLATAFFLHAFVYRRGRGYAAGFAFFQTLMLYTHGWGIFYGLASFAALIVLWWRSEERRALAIDGLGAYGAAAILFLPWFPTVLFQASHTAAPWGRAPRFGAPIQISRDLLGGDRASIVLLLIGGFGLAQLLQAHRDKRDRERLSVYVLVIIPIVTLAIAWTLSQFNPAWASRYFAVALGAMLLLSALGLAARENARHLRAARADGLLAQPEAVRRRLQVRRARHRRRGRLADETGRPRDRRPAGAGAGRLVLHARRPQIRRLRRPGRRSAPHGLGRRDGQVRVGAAPGGPAEIA